MELDVWDRSANYSSSSHLLTLIAPNARAARERAVSVTGDQGHGTEGYFGTLLICGTILNKLVFTGYQLAYDSCKTISHVMFE